MRVSSGTDNVSNEASPREAFYALLLEAARLVDAIGDSSANERYMYEAGWKASADVHYQRGYEAGYEQACAEMSERFVRMASHAQIPTYAERQQMDQEYVEGVPCRSKCGRCSRCIRAEAVKRHGGDYQGDGSDLAEVIEIRRGIA